MEPNPTVELRLRAAVESAPSGLLMIDARGNMVLVNREIERMFGYSREELLGRPIELLVPERFREGHPDYRGSFFADPKVRAIGTGRDLYGRRRDGTEVPVEIGLTPVATEEGLFVISSIVDISARKRAESERGELEEQLRQAQKMEAVGRLAGGIAHDFNNVLGAIVGYAELARQAATGRPELAADIEEVIRSATRGRALVNRILSFSRRQDVSRAAIDLGQAVAEAAELLRATLPASIAVKLRAPPELPRVVADATSVQQVVMNLGTNAAHAMPVGGLVELDLEAHYAYDSFARAHPGLREGRCVLLKVRDSGEGMDEATRARAFEPFFTTKPQGAGTGLGLAVVHGIAKNHSGAVWLESEVGQGTTVHCLFPAVEEAAEHEGAAVETAEAVPHGHGERILYVDDEDALARIGQRVLAQLGYRPTVFTDPQRALSAFRSDPAAFDLVITDYSMPGMNGVQLAAALTAIPSNIPIVLLSGYVDAFPEACVRASGVRHVVTKPLTLLELAEAVRTALTDHAAQDDLAARGDGAGAG